MNSKTYNMPFGDGDLLLYVTLGAKKASDVWTKSADDPNLAFLGNDVKIVPPSNFDQNLNWDRPGDRFPFAASYPPVPLTRGESTFRHIPEFKYKISTREVDPNNPTVSRWVDKDTTNPAQYIFYTKDNNGNIQKRSLTPEEYEKIKNLPPDHPALRQSFGERNFGNVLAALIGTGLIGGTGAFMLKDYLLGKGVEKKAFKSPFAVRNRASDAIIGGTAKPFKTTIIDPKINLKSGPEGLSIGADGLSLKDVGVAGQSKHDAPYPYDDSKLPSTPKLSIIEQLAVDKLKDKLIPPGLQSAYQTLSPGPSIKPKKQEGTPDTEVKTTESVGEDKPTPTETPPTFIEKNWPWLVGGAGIAGSGLLGYYLYNRSKNKDKKMKKQADFVYDKAYDAADAMKRWARNNPQVAGETLARAGWGFVGVPLMGGANALLATARAPKGRAFQHMVRGGIVGSGAALGGTAAQMAHAALGGQSDDLAARLLMGFGGGLAGRYITRRLINQEGFEEREKKREEELLKAHKLRSSDLEEKEAYVKKADNKFWGNVFSGNWSDAGTELKGQMGLDANQQADTFTQRVRDNFKGTPASWFLGGDKSTPDGKPSGNILDNNWANLAMWGAPIGAGLGLIGGLTSRKKKKNLLGDAMWGGLLGLGAGGLVGGAYDLYKNLGGSGNKPPATNNNLRPDSKLPDPNSVVRQVNLKPPEKSDLYDRANTLATDATSTVDQIAQARKVHAPIDQMTRDIYPKLVQAGRLTEARDLLDKFNALYGLKQDTPEYADKLVDLTESIRRISDPMKPNNNAVSAVGGSLAGVADDAIRRDQQAQAPGMFYYQTKKDDQGQDVRDDNGNLVYDYNKPITYSNDRGKDIPLSVEYASNQNVMPSFVTNALMKGNSRALYDAVAQNNSKLQQVIRDIEDNPRLIDRAKDPTLWGMGKTPLGRNMLEGAGLGAGVGLFGHPLINKAMSLAGGSVDEKILRDMASRGVGFSSNTSVPSVGSSNWVGKLKSWTLGNDPISTNTEITSLSSMSKNNALIDRLVLASHNAGTPYTKSQIIAALNDKNPNTIIPNLSSLFDDVSKGGGTLANIGASGMMGAKDFIRDITFELNKNWAALKGTPGGVTRHFTEAEVAAVLSGKSIGSNDISKIIAQQLEPILQSKYGLQAGVKWKLPVPGFTSTTKMQLSAPVRSATLGAGIRNRTFGAVRPALLGAGLAPLFGNTDYYAGSKPLISGAITGGDIWGGNKVELSDADIKLGYGKWIRATGLPDEDKSWNAYILNLTRNGATLPENYYPK